MIVILVAGISVGAAAGAAVLFCPQAATASAAASIAVVLFIFGLGCVHAVIFAYGLLESCLSREEIVYRLAYRELGLCERELGVVKVCEGTAAHLIALGGVNSRRTAS